MIPYVRKQKILNYMEGKEIVYLKDLVNYLNSSLSTVRRDLNSLAQEGVVTLLNGGAVTITSRSYDLPVEKKKQTNITAKDIIARKASEIVENGDVIYIDSGTTTIQMIKYLKNKKITIVTSSLTFPRDQLTNDIKLIYLGGELLTDLESLVGSITEKQLLSMYFDKAFIGANGYSEQGVFTFDLREARKKEIVRNQSRQAFLLVDTSKEGKRGFARAFGLEECTLITEKDEDESESTSDYKSES